MTDRPKKVFAYSVMRYDNGRYTMCFTLPIVVIGWT